VSERRIEPRHPVVITIELAVDRGLSLNACENLSAGGAFFRHAVPYKVGTQVHVSFGLPGDARPVRCLGEVVNVPDPREYGMGVRFIGLAEEERARIAAFTERVSQGAAS
jgi:uncharacterized protein (TIGR02266 family)